MSARRFAAALVAALALGACTAPSDDDGEPVPAGRLAPVAAPGSDAVPVVVDTDLGADDLLALALLLRRTDVDVRAVTIATTGLAFQCAPAVDVLADLLAALDEPPVPVACGSPTLSDRGRPFPSTWRLDALAGNGLPRDPGASLRAEALSAPELLAELALAAPGELTLVAIGPLTNVAALAADRPDAYAALAAVHAMGGVVDGPGEGDVGEWNAAADPEALDAVLAGPVPVTVVPADAVPPGTPDALRAPVLGHVVLHAQAGAWWDLAAVAAFVAPDDVVPEDAAAVGTWAQDDVEAGRLRLVDAHGGVRVLRALDEAGLAAVYADAFRVVRG